MRLAVVGASGRMGRAVIRIAHEQGVEVACAIGATDVGRDAGELAGVGATGVCVVDGLAALEHARADVVVDFSSPAGTLALAPVAAASGVAVVSGTTGLEADARDALDRASARIPVLWEPNMSIGVHVLAELVERAASALAAWDVEIVETHHRAKVDAPSGTALRLAGAVKSARAGSRLVHGREGKPGVRAAEEIGIHAVRGGDVVGDHVVHLLGGGERLELAHRATSRDVFAHGALRAARWIAGRAAGRYTLGDVLRT
ncbi:MAG TPA: 4-hydroxy-tetrahydrodipicolinate reductase [Polyangiaceae bacterium]|jgi:4-hydroxy-tetrahydrodipicolinate reductase